LGFQFRQAICNEVYGKRPLLEVCRSIRAIGYTGIEIAPFTLSESPGDLTPAVRREYRDLIVSEGLSFVGLHWLMVSPEGLHVTTPDRELRERSWAHIYDLIDLCADLGDDGIMVFGSPKQRSTQGIPVSEATKNYTEGLAGVAPHAESRGVTILVEALPRNQSDVINTLSDAAEIVNQIGSTAVRTMFDTHNAADETEPHAAVVERYFDLIRHVHVNEMDGRHPGTADYDFKSIFSTLRLGYGHWISLEAFDFSPGAENIATESLRFIGKEISQLAA
jgi:D-psicose/D-tagatose/L-ribulose 3-epimerase